MVTVREPTSEDAHALGQIHVRAWQHAYRGGLMPDDYLDALSAEERADMWRDGLQRPPRPRSTRLVAEHDDGTVVGFVLAGPADGDAASDLGEIYALNVDPNAWGQGAGQALLDAALTATAQAGFPETILWVHPDNARARRFYERNGWNTDGERRRQEVLGVDVPEVRYRHPLDGTRSRTVHKEQSGPREVRNEPRLPEQPSGLGHAS